MEDQIEEQLAEALASIYYPLTERGDKMSTSKEAHAEIAGLLTGVAALIDAAGAVDTKEDLPLATMYAQVAQATAQLAIALILCKWDAEGFPGIKGKAE